MVPNLIKNIEDNLNEQISNVLSDEDRLEVKHNSFKYKLGFYVSIVFLLVAILTTLVIKYINNKER